MFLGLLLSGNVNAQEIDGKAHELYKCKLSEDRTYMEKQFCKMQAKQYRLCKLDEQCALIKIEALKKEIEELKKRYNQ